MSWKEWKTKRKKKEMPGGLWMRCTGCENMVFRKTVDEQLKVCPECGYHFRISAKERIRILADAGSFVRLHDQMCTGDPLHFRVRDSYTDKLVKARKATGLDEAAIIGRATIEGMPLVLGVTDPFFIMGSMGSVVGERLTVAAEVARADRVPLVIVSGSGGGARMQEGIFSLFQMAKVSGALACLDEEGILYVSLLTDATMGGTMASFASLGDVILAEPGALLGFTGPRVIRETIKKELPKGFQTAEFLLEHGFIDRICPRPELKTMIARIVRYATANPRQERRGKTARRRKRAVGAPE